MIIYNCKRERNKEEIKMLNAKTTKTVEINENTKYVAVLEIRDYILKMSKDKTPNLIIAVGETEEEASNLGWTEFRVNFLTLADTIKVVPIEEINLVA